MNEQEYEQFKDKVTKVWTDDPDFYGSTDFTVEVHTRTYPPHVEVTVRQTYEFVPLAFKHLKALSEIFGTENFTVNQSSSSECETCDYGSSYEHTFTYTPTN